MLHPAFCRVLLVLKTFWTDEWKGWQEQQWGMCLLWIRWSKRELWTELLAGELTEVCLQSSADRLTEVCLQSSADRLTEVWRQSAANRQQTALSMIQYDIVLTYHYNFALITDTISQKWLQNTVPHGNDVPKGKVPGELCWPGWFKSTSQAVPEVSLMLLLVLIFLCLYYIHYNSMCMQMRVLSPHDHKDRGCEW